MSAALAANELEVKCFSHVSARSSTSLHPCDRLIYHRSPVGGSSQVISTPFTVFCSRRQIHSEVGEVTREINRPPTVSFYRLMCQKRISALSHPVLFFLRCVLLLLLLFVL